MQRVVATLRCLASEGPGKGFPESLWKCISFFALRFKEWRCGPYTQRHASPVAHLLGRFLEAVGFLDLCLLRSFLCAILKTTLLYFPERLGCGRVSAFAEGCAASASLGAECLDRAGSWGAAEGLGNPPIESDTRVPTLQGEKVAPPSACVSCGRKRTLCEAQPEEAVCRECAGCSACLPEVSSLGVDLLSYFDCRSRCFFCRRRRARRYGF